MITFLGDNEIGDEAGEFIAKALETNMALTSLKLGMILGIIEILYFLGFAGIGRRTYFALATALLINESLSNLDICKIIIF